MRFAPVLLSIALAAPASAVLTDAPSTDWGTLAFAPDAGFEHVGLRGKLSAVYLGGGVVLTAHHVGAGDVTFGGSVHRLVPDSSLRLSNRDGTLTDLLLFAVAPHPELPPLEISPERPAYGRLLIPVGNGRDRGEPTTWDPNGPYPPELTDGYLWLTSRTIRWGINYAEVFPYARVFNTEVFGSRFDQPGSFLEAQAVTGDSGGAVFVAEPDGTFLLAGLIIAIEQYADQPPATTFYGQATYYADLSVYRDDIEQAIALPEPGGGLVPGGALLAWWVGRRRRGRRREDAAPLPPAR